MTLPTEDVGTSQSPSGLRQELIANKDDKPYRHAYADESLNISIATQLKVLREQRAMTQGELAREAEMKQPMISRYENVNYSSWSISTLKKLAFAFDVWLDVRFRSFGDMVKTVERFGRDSLQVPTFETDAFFKDRTLAPLARRRRRARERRRKRIIPAGLSEPTKRHLDNDEPAARPLAGAPMVYAKALEATFKQEQLGFQFLSLNASTTPKGKVIEFVPNANMSAKPDSEFLRGGGVSGGLKQTGT